MKITTEVLREAEQYVEHFMKEHMANTVLFHNYKHTVKVVRVCDMLSMESDLNKHDRLLVHIAGWFTNIGYKEDPLHHEEHSAKHARIYLEAKGFDKDDVEEIEACLIATKIPQHPHTGTARILCDAVLYHLSDTTYFDELELLRKEWELTRNEKYADDAWLELNIEFLENHFYFSPFARKNFDTEKRNNLIKLKAQLAVIKHGAPGGSVENIDSQRNLFDSKTKFDRGVETVFRTASHNHMQLSLMGDRKASLLISINSIILSIIISMVFTKLDTHKFLVIPTLLLIAVSVTTIVLAILSTRPKISHGKFTPQQIIRREANLLFFGNFHDMPLLEYKSAVKDMMLDNEYLYESLIMDIYFMGKVLARKYRLTTWAYSVFMIGLVTCMLAYIIFFLVFDKG